jgi:plastocyanin
MRYGHLLAILVFLLAMLVLVVMVLTGVSPSNKIDVTAKSTVTPTVTSLPTSSTTTGYYTMPVSAQTATVTYTDNGFSPSVLTVKPGTTVVFENKTSNQFWPASDPHPTHTAYPGQGNCNGQAFDPCAALAPGTTWALLFDKSGNWGYHNHLNPSHEGTILVK